MAAPAEAPPYDSPQACERAFYAAFSACDLEAMMAVWAERAPLLCIHPGGPPLTDRDEVARSWAHIFRGGGGVEFTLSHLQARAGGDVAVRYVHENIHHGPGLRATAVVCATNVYVREEGGWRMCAHHASPGPAPAPGTEESGAVH